MKLRLTTHLKDEESVWRQRSKDKWLEEGDRNTRYFHTLPSYRCRGNYIEEVWCDGKKVQGNTELREAARGYFLNLYKEDREVRPNLNGLPFNRISEMSCKMLKAEFTTEEVLDGLKSCNGNKALGPNGFNLKFLKVFWYLLKDDIMCIFKELYYSGKFVESLNSTFITLIPKRNEANEFKDFRPISLVGCVYKLIAKVLGRRLFRCWERLLGNVNMLLLKEDRFLTW